MSCFLYFCRGPCGVLSRQRCTYESTYYSFIRLRSQFKVCNMSFCNQYVGILLFYLSVLFYRGIFVQPSCPFSLNGIVLTKGPHTVISENTPNTEQYLKDTDLIRPLQIYYKSEYSSTVELILKSAVRIWACCCVASAFSPRFISQI